MIKNIKYAGALKIIKRTAVYAVILAAYIILGVFFSAHTPVYNPYSSGAGGEINYEKAQVTAVTGQEISKSNFPGLYTGRQIVTVRVLSGQYSGRTFTMDNALNYDTNYVLHKGQNIVVSVNTSTGNKSVINLYMYSPDRLLPAVILIGLFAAALLLVGGRRGLNSILGIIFTVSSLVLYFIPLLYHGVSPVAASILFAALTSCVTLFLIGGFSQKTFAAILGTVAGVLVSVVIMVIFGAVMQVSGYTSSDTDALLNIAGQSRLQVKDLLFAGIIISSLGAVMDIAISVASAISELSLNKPGASFKALFLSGMNVGRDMMGTMTGTLILAFAGESVFSLILMYSYKVQFLQLINSGGIVTDILEAVCGSFAVVLCVPIVSLIAAKLSQKESLASSDNYEQNRCERA